MGWQRRARRLIGVNCIGGRFVGISVVAGSSRAEANTTHRSFPPLPATANAPARLNHSILLRLRDELLSEDF